MAEVAALGLKITSEGVEKATSGLSEFAGAARKAEAAAESFEASTKGADSGAKAISASTTKAASDTSKLETASKTAAGSLERMATSSNAVAGSMTRAAAGVNTASSSVQSMTKAANDNVNRFGGSMSGLAAQFQDIGVTASMGMSPVMIALQQGTQIAGQMEMAMQSGARATTVFATAIRSLLSPITFVSIALTALAAVVIQFFMDWVSRGQEANLTLEEQSKLIQKVASDWGDATPRMKAYADELERAARMQELLTAANAAAAAQYAPVENALVGINRQFIEAVRSLRGFGSETDIVVRDLTSSFGTLQEKIGNGTATTDDLTTAQNAMANAVNNYGTPAIQQLAAAFGAIVPQINAAINAAAGFRQEASGLARIAMFPSRGVYGGVDRSANGPIIGGPTTPEVGPVPGRRPLIELDGLPRTGGGGGAKKLSDYAAETKALNEQVQALQAQTAAQASLNPLVNDYGYALAKAKAETDLLLAAQRDGKPITEALKAEVSGLASGYAQATADQKRQIEAQREAKRAFDDAKGAFKGFITDLRTGLQNGEGFFKSFANAATNLLDKVISKIEDEFVNALFSASGTGGGGLFGGFLGGIGKLFGFANGGAFQEGVQTFAKGGAFTNQIVNRPTPFRFARGAGLMGEAGPEAIMPLGRDGNGRLGVYGAANQNGGGVQYVVVEVQGNLVEKDGQITATIDKRSQKQIQRAAPGIVNAAKQQAVPAMAEYQANVAGSEWR